MFVDIHKSRNYKIKSLNYKLKRHNYEIKSRDNDFSFGITTLKIPLC